MAHNEPGDDCPAECQAVLPYAEVECLGRVEARLLQEIDDVSAEPDAAPDLDHPHAADDLGASEINTGEAVQVPDAFADMLFVLVRVHHHGYLSIYAVASICYGGEASQSLLRILQPALAYQPPGRLGG